MLTVTKKRKIKALFHNNYFKKIYIPENISFSFSFVKIIQKSTYIINVRENNKNNNYKKKLSHPLSSKATTKAALHSEQHLFIEIYMKKSCPISWRIKRIQERHSGFGWGY